MEVNKLRILSIRAGKNYFDSGVAGALGGALSIAAGTIFEVQINPEKITQNFKINYNQPETPGCGEGQSGNQFNRTQLEVLELQFTLDGTGTVQNNSLFSIDPVNLASAALSSTDQLAFVTAKIEQLKATVYGMLSGSHAPPILVVNWGKLVFVGVLESMTINETLKHPSGLPMRAEIDLKIKEISLGKAASAVLSLLSPDLTRHHLVIAGENILRICDDIYESEHHYLEIAKVNELTNFRKITPGQNLIFPPINKAINQ